jgi:iron complex outermembrane receptor protein
MLAASLATYSQGMAQTTGAAAQTDLTAPTEKAAPTGETQLEEIIVTARKRLESVEDVPIAITALSSEQLEENRIENVSQLDQVVPGLMTLGSDWRGYPVIRGMSSRVPEIGAENTVGQYIDEVYQPRSAAQLASLLDIDRIEVLKGPQGTLFGRNTIAGAINYVTQEPSDQLTESADLTIGNRSRVEGHAAVSGPLTSDLDGRVAIMALRDDGNVDLVNASGDKIGDNGDRDYGVRASLLWTPAAGLKVNAAYSHLRTGSATDELVNGNPAGPLATPLALVGLFTPSPFVANYHDYEVGLNTPGHLTQTTDAATFRIDDELTDQFKLTSLTAYTHFNQSSLMDIDYEVLPVATYEAPQSSNTASQELRLAYDAGKVFSGTVGANYFYDDQFSASLFPITLPFGDLNWNQTTDVKTTSSAAFTQLYVRPVEVLTLSGGFRYTHDTRSYRVQNVSDSPIFGATFDTETIPGLNTRPSWGGGSYNVSVDYHPVESTMLYVSNSKGYRSGGVQGGQTTIAAATQNYGPETAEQYEIGAKSWLLDRKMSLDIAAYHIDYTNMQVSQAVLTQVINSIIVTNAGKASMQGVEMQSALLPAPWVKFELGYSYNDSHFVNYQSATNIPGAIAGTVPPCAFVPSAFGCNKNDYNYDGTPLFYAPKHSLDLAVTLRHELASGASLHIRPSYSWKSSYLLANLPQSVYNQSQEYLESHFLEQHAFGLLNLIAGVDFPGGNWSLNVWGQNLTAERYLTIGGAVPYAVAGYPQVFDYGQRMTFGMTVAWHPRK